MLKVVDKLYNLGDRFPVSRTLKHVLSMRKVNGGAERMRSELRIRIGTHILAHYSEFDRPFEVARDAFLVQKHPTAWRIGCAKCHGILRWSGLFN